jgi:hypothetical protein
MNFNSDFYDIPEGYMEIPQDQLRDLIEMVGGDAPNLSAILDSCAEYDKAGVETKILWDQQSSGVYLRVNAPPKAKAN